MTNLSYRAAWVDVDLDAVKNNVALMAAEFAPSMVCVAVKANAYGHGAVQVALAAIEGGAQGLAVALVEEGIELREANIDVPILLLYEPDVSVMGEVVRARLTPTIYTPEGVRAFSAAVASSGKHPQPVHVALDTGMHREGSSPAMFLDLCKWIADDKNLLIEGVSTHFAVADEPASDFTALQFQRFRQTIDAVFPSAKPPLVHCSNSPAALAFPEMRMNMVRVGASTYGIQPAREVPLLQGTVPAMSVRAQVSTLKDVAAGEAISYGQQYHVARNSRIASVPVGYGDGLVRAMGINGEVLIGGHRRKIAGTVSMDQVMVDCGGDQSIRVGDEVVFLGSQGSQQITALDIAEWAQSDCREVVTQLSSRLPRRYTQGGAAVDLRQQRLSLTDA